jgi:hypothetical protein
MRQADFKGIYETDDWLRGKKRNRFDPDFKPNPPETVTCLIGRDVAMKFFGAVDNVELQRHLKSLRECGLLIHDPDMLSSQIRVHAPGKPGGIGHVRGYVIRGRRDEVPKISHELRRQTRKRRKEPEQGRLIGAFRA